MPSITSTLVWRPLRAGLLSVTALTVSLWLPANLLGLPVQAVELTGGKTSFIESPLLIEATATSTNANAPSTYEFTITVPEGAGEPLKAVTIAQKENVEGIEFDVSESHAYIAGNSQVELASIGGSQEGGSNEVTIVFDKPVEPGKTVTVAIETKQNPQLGGIYLFGVTAYPPGENSPGLYLGVGRLHFYESNN